MTIDPELKEIKALRKRLGLTQEQLARDAGVSQSLIAKIEAGLVDPSFSSGRRILETLRALAQRGEAEAKEVMQRHVIRCRADEKVASVVAVMRKHAISQLPVTDGDNVVGILSESTIVRSMESLGPRTRVADIMDESPPIIPPQTPRRVVAELLRHYSLVVVKEKGRLQGIITRADLLKTV